ncbi:MAG: 3-deoxy-manno-octulosonate cytidylyltransferase [Candidatus Omnitrophica bacterium]|nr:3-deoxy-manno-octulosonate cytidylyltransferase [Candidatus Omnitrophota bacterium]MBI3010388.1 3-deoxy-manno-octulosonate cytidylyltransferase [Candidatus Omnitrophota bacterium]
MQEKSNGPLQKSGVLVVIPARYGSVRFPGKPLALLDGKPMIQHVYQRAFSAKGIGQVVVATDDDRICQAVRSCGGEALMTNPQAQSGTERAAEVARSSTAGVIINVQGDEPLIHPEIIHQLAAYLSQHAAVPMASAMTPLKPEDLSNPNVVKVVVDRDGFALYFSRAAIPHVRQQSWDKGAAKPAFRGTPSPAKIVPARSAANPAVGGTPSPAMILPARSQGTGDMSHGPRPMSQIYWKHLGIYGYQRNFLLQFPHLEATLLEQCEKLEQLRALEHGYRIKMIETIHDSIGVDTPEDLIRVEALLRHS